MEPARRTVSLYLTCKPVKFSTSLDVPFSCTVQDVLDLLNYEFRSTKYHFTGIKNMDNKDPLSRHLLYDFNRVYLLHLVVVLT